MGAAAARSVSPGGGPIIAQAAAVGLQAQAPAAAGMALAGPKGQGVIP